MTEAPIYPDTILIFRHAFEDAGLSPAAREEEIAITVRHEVAHSLEISEARRNEFNLGEATWLFFATRFDGTWLATHSPPA